MVRTTTQIGLAIFVILGGALTAPTYATTYNWTGASGVNAFVVNANWSPNTASPSAGDTATFGLGGDREITLAYFNPPGFPLFGQTNITVADLNVLLGNVTLSNSIIGSFVYPETMTVTDRVYLPNANGTSSLTFGAPGFPVSLDTNQLTVQNGANISVKYGSNLHTYQLDQYDAGLNGNLTIDGSGSHFGWSGPWDYQIGSLGGNGSLTVQNGGFADFSLALNVIIAGDNTSSTGAISINGTNSTLDLTNAVSLQVGSPALGTGTVNVGTTVSGGTLTIGASQFSNGLQIHKTGSVTVGSNSTTGTLNVAEPLLVDGGVLRVYSGSLFNLQPGSVLTIDNSGTADFKSYTPNRSQLNFVSGSLSYAGNLRVGSGGLLGDGDLVLNNDRQLSVNPVPGVTGGTGVATIDPGQTLTIAGGSLNASSLTNNGTLSLSSGTLNTGTATLVSGTPGSKLAISLGGTTRFSQYGALVASGTVDLGGSLVVTLNNFTPAVGNSFDILDGSLSGTFTNVQLPALPAGRAWNSSQLNTSGLLSIVAAAGVTGDYNNNGIVDAADYVLWRANQGTNNVLANDPIGGTIGAAQFNQWRAHFGQTAGSGAGAIANAAVPEPATCVLLVIAAAGLCPRRCRSM